MLLLALVALVGQAAPPRAGSTIINQGRVSYRDAASRLTWTLESNTVSAEVAPLEALTLTAPLRVAAMPGSIVELPHTVHNTGNVQSVYDLLAQADVLAILQVVHDRNGNGRADADEPAITPDAPLTLDPGQTAQVVLVVRVPTDATIGQAQTVTLTARTRQFGQTATNQDTVETAHGVVMRLVNAASADQVPPLGRVTFTLTATNSGIETAGPLVVTVDGVPTPLLVIRNPVPANTTLVRAGGATPTAPPPAGGRLLYHLAGDPADVYTAHPPADLAAVDAVALGLPAMGPGVSAALAMEVQVGRHAAGVITDTGAIHYQDPTSAGPAQVTSNTVRVVVPGAAPTIAYYTDESFATTTEVIALGHPLYVQATAAFANTDSGVRETIRIAIRSALTGDVEAHTATETGPNTGVFRIDPPPPTRDGRLHPTVAGNGALESRANDHLIATVLGYDGPAIAATVLVDPYGVVFDGITNAPVGGAVVTLIDVTGAGNGGLPGGPARVFLFDGLTPAPSTVTTGPDGQYSFPRVAPSTYRLAITPPARYTYPSAVPPALIAPGRLISDASYGAGFTISADSAAVQIDVPLDYHPALGLLVTKTAGRTVVELGETLVYTVTIRNTGSVPLTPMVITDDLPVGFAYTRGSIRLDGAPVADPAGAPGPRLIFAVGTLNPDQQIVLTYRAVVGVGAVPGPATNHVRATGASLFGQTVSNDARATVAVTGGPFTDRGIILGKVYVDRDRNRVQGPEEPGIPGVRLFLDDGTWVVTDSEGKYSLYGVTARTHALRLDMTTMPPGSEPINLTNRMGGDAISAYVDVVPGMVSRADFAEGASTPPVLADIRRRRLARPGREGELELRPLRPEDRLPNALDARGLPATGTVGVNGAPTLPCGIPCPLPPTPRPAPAPSPDAPLSPDQLDALTPDLAILWPLDGAVVPAAQTRVRVKGRAGATLALQVNGEPVPSGRIGLRTTHPGNEVQVLEYIGVALMPGVNTLSLSQVDPFGNPRGEHTIRVTVPGALARMVLLPSTKQAAADGRTVVPVAVQLVDARDVPVHARTEVTLDASLGTWLVDDVNPGMPGVQTFITGGEASLGLVAPREPGVAALRAQAGVHSADARIAFVHELRALIAVGVLEAMLTRRHGDAAAGTRFATWGFAQELRHVSTLGDVHAGVRAQAFLQGRVRGNYLLTLAYDSEKRTGERLFRDIQPDEYYPVYGDAAGKGYDAQSTLPLYIRVDKGRSYGLFGDFTTGAADAASLSAYTRSLSGLRHHAEGERLTVDTFASRTSMQQAIDERRANGTSGPYALTGSPVVENSEVVEVLVRDRDQPSIIRRTVRKVRFLDYEVDHARGEILFRDPIPSVDSDLNPVYVRVSYEVAAGGPSHWVTGARGTFRLARGVTVGAAWAHDDHPLMQGGVWGGHLAFAPTAATRLVVEAARSTRLGTGTGWGRRIELTHEDARLDMRGMLGHTDPTFDNAAATLGRGRNELLLSAGYRVGPATRLQGQVLRSEDLTNGGVREGYEASASRAFSGGIRVEAGLRHATETTSPAQAATAGATPIDFTSARLKLTAPLPRQPDASVSLEYEQDVRDAARRALALGADTRLSGGGRLYGRHELISSFAGRFALNTQQSQMTTVVGLDSPALSAGHVFSEYRVRDAFSGREAEAAIGLRNRWQVGRGTRVDGSIERLHALQGGNDNESLAVTGGVELTGSARWKGTARAEARQADAGDSLLSTVGFAYKLDRDWTGLARALYQRTSAAAGRGMRAQTQIGAAFRPVDANRWHGLLRYEFRRDRAPGAPTASAAHLFVADANYQPRRDLLYGFHYAGRAMGHGADATLTQAVLVRATHDYSERADVGLVAGVLSTNRGQRQIGYGVEAGYLTYANVWLSAGYNVRGFRDGDLTGESYMDRGPYVRLRIKFDEDTLLGRRTR